MESPTSRHNLVRLLLVAAVAAITVGGYVLWGHRTRADTAGQITPKAESTKNGSSAPVVTLATAETEDFPVYLNSLGTVQGLNTVVVRTRVDGQIERIAFQEGQLVHEGDVLAEIDPRPFQATVDQALAKRAQDSANLANANLDLQRYTKLGDFATGQQKDTQRSTVTQLSAQIEADDAAIANAKTQLDYATIRAPITGIAGLRQVDKGNIVNAATQTGIVTIAQVEPIAAIFTVPESQLSDLNQAMKKGALKVAALSADGRKTLSEGTLAVVNNQVDTSTGTVRLKAIFDNKDHALWPGLAISTRLLLTTVPGAVVVPDDVIQHGPDGLFAFVVLPDKKAEQRKVKAGPSVDGKTLVEDGLKPGEKVILSGQYKVQPGKIVSVSGDVSNAGTTTNNAGTTPTQ